MCNYPRVSQHRSSYNCHVLFFPLKWVDMPIYLIYLLQLHIMKVVPCFQKNVDLGELFLLPRLVYYINPHWDPDSGDNGGGLDVGEAQLVVESLLMV